MGNEYDYFKALKFAAKLFIVEFSSKKSRTLLSQSGRYKLCSDLVGGHFMEASDALKRTFYKHFDQLDISKVGFFSPDDFYVSS